ncbi:MAG: Holliday junction branch migration protein RuvA, partial [bacterium]
LMHKEPSRCALDVGGVGYGVNISISTFGALSDVGSQVSMPVHTYVREDQLVLYGFASPEERALFLKLIAISGVGPKTAMSILSGLPPSELVDAIASGDVARISTIPGVGKKTAERMVVELKDALGREAKMFYVNGSQSRTDSVREDALSALQNLGYPRAIAENALKKNTWSDSITVEEVLRMALRELCRA